MHGFKGQLEKLYGSNLIRVKAQFPPQPSIMVQAGWANNSELIYLWLLL